MYEWLWTFIFILGGFRILRFLFRNPSTVKGGFTFLNSLRK